MTPLKCFSQSAQYHWSWSGEGKSSCLCFYLVCSRALCDLSRLIKTNVITSTEHRTSMRSCLEIYDLSMLRNDYLLCNTKFIIEFLITNCTHLNVMHRTLYECTSSLYLCLYLFQLLEDCMQLSGFIKYPVSVKFIRKLGRFAWRSWSWGER